jgi:hypothetical protein
MDKVSWIQRLLSRLKICFSAPPPEEDESHAETRYRVAQMTPEEWRKYEQAKLNEAYNKEAEQ